MRTKFNRICFCTTDIIVFDFGDIRSRTVLARLELNLFPQQRDKRKRGTYRPKGYDDGN